MKATFYPFFLRLALACGVSLCAATGALAQFSGGGSGTAQSPYLIATAEDLNTVRSFVGADHSDKHFRLANDVDLTAYLSGNTSGWNPIGTQANPFAGTFHGGGYKVTGLTISRSAADYVGLFGYSTGSIDSLGVEGQSIAGRDYVGGLAGYSSGTVSACYATGNGTAGGERTGG